VDQYPILILLSLGTAVGALAGPAPALLVLTGHEGTYSAIAGVSVVMRIVALLLLASLFGATGAAVASLAGSIFTAVALNVASRRLVGADPAVTVLLSPEPRAR